MADTELNNCQFCGGKGQVRAAKVPGGWAKCGECSGSGRASSPAAVPEGALPPLDDWFTKGADHFPISRRFLIESMQAYARAAVEADRAQHPPRVTTEMFDSLHASLEVLEDARGAREARMARLGMTDRAQQGEPVYQLKSVIFEGGWHDIDRISYMYEESKDPASVRIVYRAATKAAAPADAPALPTEMLLKIVAENTGRRINLSLEDLDLYLAVAREAIAQVLSVTPEMWMKLGADNARLDQARERREALMAKYGIDGAAPVPDTGIPTDSAKLIGLLREARATLEMWKDVAPAVSLCADIDKALSGRAIDTDIPTIDTPEFNELLDEFAYRASERRALGGDFGSAEAEDKAASALIAHINNFRAPISTTPTSGEVEKACWSCKRAYTAEQRANADGNCPHCGAEIEETGEDA